MKITLNRVRFLEQLSKAVRVVSSKEIIQVLGCIYLKAEFNEITIIGGDSTTYLIAKISPDHYQLHKSGTVAIQSRLLYEIVKKIDEDEIILSSDADSQIVTITTISSNSKFVLKLLDVEEYPLPEHIGNHTSLTIDGETLKEFINQTIFAVYKREDTPALTGVKMDVMDNKLVMVGCDRHRLGRIEQIIATEETVIKNCDVIIPSRTMNELERLIASEPIEIKVSETKIEFAGDDFILIAKSISGAYPDVDRSLRSDFLSHFLVNAQSLISSLDRVSIIASQEKTNLISMKVSSKSIELYSYSEINNASEHLPLSDFNGEEFVVSFNVKYALEALRAMDVKEVIVQVNKGMQMILFTSEEKSGTLQLIMATRSVR